ncbi:MAG: hypothetical protein GH149_03180 [Methanosarcinales archaeon]|nr:hypothetical protein [Methanosarcinales archaeon]
MAEAERDMGIGVDKLDTRGDAEKFKGLYRELGLHRIYFLSLTFQN